MGTTGQLFDSQKLARDLAGFCFASRPVINRYFRQDITIEDKADNSPVTIADKQAEAAIRGLLSQAYPDHNIVGEEQGGVVSGGFDWVIDPIDGTRAFIAGKPTFGTLIALCDQRRPVASVIDMPVMDEMFIAVPDRQTTLNGEAISTSGITQIAQARIASTAPEALDEGALQRYLGLSKTCRSSHWGGDCYNYALLAAGHIDIVIEHQLASHDIMALVPVIEQAGGIVTDWQGGPVRLGETEAIIACASQRLHESVLKVMCL